MGRAYPRGGAPGSTGQEKAVTIVSPYAAIESRHWETPASDGRTTNRVAPASAPAPRPPNRTDRPCEDTLFPENSEPNAPDVQA
jgi:hypothetical protein